uniref:T-box domain-containing protein n=1 Tax=Caenorhabditis tropicalis TaxID=1561998 RepID=A0A1I7V3R8_9PELO
MDSFYTAEIKQEPINTVAIKMEQDINTLRNVDKNTTVVTGQKEPNLIDVKTEPVNTYDIKMEPIDTVDKENESINTLDIENKPIERFTIHGAPIVTVAVLNPNQWETNGTKAIKVTTQRSRPKPQFGFVVTGLRPQKEYRFFMKLELEDCFKYKYRADLGMFCRESIEKMSSGQKKPTYVEHHLGTMPGSFWTSKPIVFSELFFSTAKKCKNDTFKVLTRRAYQASLVIKNEDGTIAKEFCDPLHSFVIVSDSARNYEKETEEASSGTKRPNEGYGTPAQKMMKVEIDDY